MRIFRLPENGTIVIGNAEIPLTRSQRFWGWKPFRIGRFHYWWFICWKDVAGMFLHKTTDDKENDETI